jgi:diacylglycerol kinase family enzyme
MRLLLIMNPGSRGGVSRKQFVRIFNTLDNNYIGYDYRITKNLDHAYRISAENSRAGYDVIAAVGGDGTINRVLNGFYDDSGCRTTNTKMGIIYTGTSPDFCKSYHIPVDIEKAINVLKKNRSIKIQIGRITFAKYFRDDLDRKPIEACPDSETRYFGCCANIGLGAYLAGYANGGIRNIIGDGAGTFLSLMRTLIFYRAGSFTVCHDGRMETIENMYNMSVGKTFHIASGIKINHDLEHGDKRFYNLIIRNMKPWRLANLLKTAYGSKKIVNNSIASLQYSEVVEIYGNSKNPRLEFDGDAAGFLPCRIETAKDMLDLIVDGNHIRS